MSRGAEKLFRDYAAHHQSKGNVGCHLAGIPLIVFGLSGLLSFELFAIGGRPVELSLLLILFLFPVHVGLNARLGALLTILYLGLYLVARTIAWPVNLGLFLAGWVLQFIGHSHYERRSPAFFTNLVHLFVGPLWVLNHLVRLQSVPAEGGAGEEVNPGGRTASSD